MSKGKIRRMWGLPLFFDGAPVLAASHFSVTNRRGSNRALHNDPETLREIRRETWKAAREGVHIIHHNEDDDSYHYGDIDLDEYLKSQEERDKE